MYMRTYRSLHLIRKTTIRTISKSSGIAFFLLTLTFLTAAQPSAGQILTVEGEVTKRLDLNPSDLKNFPFTEVMAKDRSGNLLIFKGTLLATILDSAGVTMGKDLRGGNLVKYVLITGADGYQVTFSLPEIDPEFTANTVLLATHANGELLPKAEGPFRLIAPQDKQQSRWVRQISSIKIVVAKN
jgi:DMSO/TMAO reductase YedYZ molybdopterin-dependent catalytic subunit